MAARRADDRRLRAGSAALVFAASLAAGVLVFLVLVQRDRPPGWDEAAHALRAALVAHDLHTWDLPALLLDLYRQVYWPPLHSLIVGAAFLLTGPSLETARAISVLAYVLLAPVLFFLARDLAPRHGTLAGAVAAALALTSPGFILFAAEGMLEAPGLLAIATTAWIYVRLERAPDAPDRGHAILGLGVVLAYLVKTNYGVLLLIALASTELVLANGRISRLLKRSNLHAILPIAIFAAIWFAYPPKLVSTWDALVNQPWGGEEARGLRGLLFYPRAFAVLSGSWWMAALLVLGSIVACRGPRRRGIVLLAVLALLQFGIGELHHTKVDRHILPMLPPMYVLAGVAAAELWSVASLRGRLPTVAVGGGLAALAAVHLASFPGRDWDRVKKPDARAVWRYVADLADESPPLLVVGTRWPDPPSLDWQLVTRERRLAVTASGSAMDPVQDRELADRVARFRLPDRIRATLLRVFERYDATPGARTIHVGNRSLDDRRSFAAALSRTVAETPPCTVVALVGIADTTRYPESFVDPLITAAGFRRLRAREFPTAEARALVYRDGGACR